MIEAVIFDVDGTLVDSVDLHARAWVEAFAHFGTDTTFKEVRSQIGKGGDQLMPVFLNQEQIESQGEEIETFRTRLFRKKYLSQVRAFPAVRDLFQRIKADQKKIALASSAKSNELSTYKQLARISDLVDTETTSDDAERSKPDPDIFVAALNKLGRVPRDRVVVVGDSPYDAEAAKKASVESIGVLCGGFPESALLTAGCIAIYRDCADLLEHYALSPLGK